MQHCNRKTTDDEAETQMLSDWALYYIYIYYTHTHTHTPLSLCARVRDYLECMREIIHLYNRSYEVD